MEQAGTSISYGTLLHQMHRSLKNMNGGGGGGGGSGLASLMGGGGGGGAGGGMSSLLGAGMKLLASRGTGGLSSSSANNPVSSWTFDTKRMVRPWKCARLI